MHRQHDDPGVLGAGLLVGVGQERELIDEPAEGRLRIAAFVLARGGHEFQQVLDSTLCLLAAFVTKVLQISTAIQHLAQRQRDGLFRGHRRQVDDQVAKCSSVTPGRGWGADADRSRAGGASRGSHSRLSGPSSESSGEELSALGRQRNSLERLHDPLADASRRNVDDPSETHIVVGIQDQLEIGECVLDFLSLVETDAADDSVGRASTSKCVFERAGLRVGAVQNGDGVLGVLVKGRPRGPRDELGLVQIVAGAVVEDLRSATAARCIASFPCGCGCSR